MIKQKTKNGTEKTRGSSVWKKQKNAITDLLLVQYVVLSKSVVPTDVKNY